MAGHPSSRGAAHSPALAVGLGVGSWQLDVRTSQLAWSPECRAIHGSEDDAGAVTTVEALLERVHPDDRAQAIAVLEETLAGRRTRHEHRYRIVRRDGQVRHVLSRARLVRDLDGKPLTLSGVDVDLTDGWSAPMADGAAAPEADAAARADDPLDGLWAEIESRFGVCPSFFKLARHEPSIARMLWRLAEFGYLDFPAPSLLKEQLFTCLSRFCRVRYCVARHAGFLVGLGRPAADAGAPTLTPDQVVALLNQPPPDGSELPAILAALEAEPAPLAAWPELGTEAGRRFRIACEQVFLDPAGARPWLAALRRLLGARRHEQLMLFLTFVRVANLWTELHPELELEDDVRQLLGEHEVLARCLQPSADQPGRGMAARLLEETDALAEYRKLAERLQLITDALPALVSHVDRDHRYTFVNSAYGKVWRLQPGTIVGRHVRDVIGADNYRLARTHLEAALGGEGTQHYELAMEVPGGQPRVAQVTYVPHDGADGSVTGATVLAIDITEQKQAEAALRESDERMRLAAAAARFGTFVLDLVTEENWWSADAKALLGLAGDELMPRGRVLGLIHPEDRERVAAKMAASFDPAGPGEFEDEHRLIGPDGRIVWVLARARTLFEQAGPERRALRAVGAFADITERKEAEGRQRLLMREVDHRARNALAVVQSIIRLTRADDPTDFVATVEGRIAAIANAHTLLAESKWRSANLRHLFERELAAHAERVRLFGDDVVLQPEAAQPLALAIHEMATNAAKYGALSSPSGRLEVTWRLDPVAGDVHVLWQESGGPSIEAPARKGFGSTLIGTALEQQLGGRMRQAWKPHGLVCELVLPAERLSNALRLPSELRSGPAARVLVVEDEALIAVDLERTLGELGYGTVGFVGRVADALRVLETGVPDAVVLDANLGGESAAPVAERLRELDIPFVVATGYGQPPDFVAASGSPLLMKPVAAEALKLALEELLASRGA